MGQTRAELEQAPGAIPAPAQAIITLLNSRPHATPLTSDLLDGDEADTILRPFTDPSGEPPSRCSALERARQLRGDLVAVLEAPDDAAVAWAQLTEHAADITLGYTFTGPAQAAVRRISGEPVVGGITAAVADLIRSGKWARIRLCANDQCRHAFYDTTRSRTQRWHSYEVCGNRHNAAAYRARRSAR